MSGFFLTTADVAVLRKLGEHLKTLVERSELTEPEPVRVTVSIGGAQALSDDTVMSVWGRADKQLYLAKRSGRNRFLI
jgi:diguanylate cyclase